MRVSGSEVGDRNRKRAAGCGAIAELALSVETPAVRSVRSRLERACVRSSSSDREESGTTRDARRRQTITAKIAKTDLPIRVGAPTVDPPICGCRARVRATDGDLREPDIRKHADRARPRAGGSVADLAVLVGPEAVGFTAVGQPARVAASDRNSRESDAPSR